MFESCACPYCGEDTELEVVNFDTAEPYLINPNVNFKVWRMACWSCGHEFKYVETWHKINTDVLKIED